MTRRDTLKAILSQRGEKLPDSNSEGSTSVLGAIPVPHMRSGAVGAMGRSLGQIAGAAEAARAMIAAGAMVVEIATDKLDASFISDRLDGRDAEHMSLVESIRTRGQQVPILVRPHPERPDRYQIAYGHRRVRALAELGRPVRAVVRVLSDEDLVVAQGQENSARTDLSYIERARFATTLEDWGFNRAIIMAALNMEKTQLSRLIALGRAIPSAVSQAIGPAPKAGRPRWAAMAEHLASPYSQAALDRLLGDQDFYALDSDARFVRTFEALTRAATGTSAAENLSFPPPMILHDQRGRKMATIERDGKRLTIVMDEQDTSGFGDFLIKSLPQLHQAFLDRHHGTRQDRAETHEG